MPFDASTPKPDQAPTARRQRINLWALAYEPDSFVVCPEGDLYGCSLCNDACIVARVGSLGAAG